LYAVISIADKDGVAVAEVAKPPGTRTPALARFPINSPSEAFLPPTCSISDIFNSDNHLTLNVTLNLFHFSHESLWLRVWLPIFPRLICLMNPNMGCCESQKAF
jgi:hypothetical protein